MFDLIFVILFLRAPLFFLLILEVFISIALIASGLFNCDIIYGGCKGTFFSHHYASNPLLIQPYPGILPILFFALFILAILVPISTLLLIVTKSKKIVIFKVILYVALILAANFYGKISGKLPNERLKCDFYSCESFAESVTKSEKESAKANNLKIYQPTYLPDVIRNTQKTRKGYYPYQLDYGPGFSIIEENHIKLDDCSIEKDRYMSGGTCEEIKDGNFEARYVYKTSYGNTYSYLTWNQGNTRIIIEFQYNPLPKDEQIKIAKSFE